MATDSGLIELYHYLYSATSSTVHFSPHVLMRNGWSFKKSPLNYNYSIKHFHKYYAKFNSFYGSFLFIEFSKAFKEELKLSTDFINNYLSKIEELIKLDSRWPELITFEEMNIPEAEDIRLVNLIRKMKKVKGI